MNRDQPDADIAPADRTLAALREQPDADASAYLTAARALEKAGRPDDADALLSAAVERFGEHMPVWVDYATMASERQAWNVAATRWDQVRNLFPEHSVAYWRGIQALMLAGRHDDADALGVVALARFPADPRVAFEHAWVAENRRDWAECLRRWEDVQRRFPDQHDGFTFGARALMGSGRLDEAEALLLATRERFPKVARPWFEYARCAANRKDWPETARRCEQMHDRFPDDATIDTLWIWVLLRLGSGDQAEALACVAVARSPMQSQLLVQWANVATWRHDWPEAVRRWDIVQSRFPRTPDIEAGVANLRLAMQSDQEEHAATAPPAAAPQAAVADARGDGTGTREIPLAEIFQQFVSLGDNCEFGLVQRAAGIEPLGLLRWASNDPARLLAALDCGFDGVGLAENTRLGVNASEEYTVHDNRYFSSHTFIHVGQMDPDKLLAQMCRRLSFLKDRLIEDLQAGERIFVFKRGDGGLTNAEIAALSKAVGAYGDNILLCVRKPDLPGQDRTVVRVARDLMIGYISELDPDTKKAQAYSSAWFEVCRAAYRLARQDAQAADLPAHGSAAI